jgi:serine/threonine-protein kinase
MKDGVPLLPVDPSTPAGGAKAPSGDATAGRTDPAAGLQGRLLNGRYAIEKRVGEGGMAFVYRAVDRETGRQVAIKVLMARLATDLESVARLKREAQLALKLNHPNVCGILAYGESAGLPFLVMPYLAGESLSKREARGPMPPARALPILIQLCTGLQHAHEQGVLHRDLKPENVMLVQDGGHERAVVMDFGLAKEQIMGPELNRLTATGIVLGTPEFMSPEQIRGKTLDARSDVYALGVLAFELLSAQLPFAGTNAQETMLNHLTGRPRRLRSVLPSIPEPLDLAIDRALRVDPAERFPSMAEFGAALARIKA